MDWWCLNRCKYWWRKVEENWNWGPCNERRARSSGMRITEEVVGVIKGVGILRRRRVTDEWWGVGRW